MPLIHKRRIWWEPVAGAADYVVYVSPANRGSDRAAFSWGNTPGVISKPVHGKTELIIPDEWPEFPARPGMYQIAITSRNDLRNESDPLILSGVFSFIAPASPSKGGIESFLPDDAEPEELHQPFALQERTMIHRGLEQVKNSREVEEAFLGTK